MTRQHPARAADDAVQAEIIGGEVSCSNGRVRHDRSPPREIPPRIERISISDELSPAPSTYRERPCANLLQPSLHIPVSCDRSSICSMCDKNVAQAVGLRRALTMVSLRSTHPMTAVPASRASQTA